MYNPLNGSYTGEFVELYNPTANSINLSGWNLSDNSETDTLVLVSGNSTVISIGGYAVITANTTSVNVSASAIHLSTGDVRIGNGLANVGDIVTIRNSAGTIIDTVNYTSLLSCADGYSLERINSSVGSDDPTNWQNVTLGGTPGASNGG